MDSETPSSPSAHAPPRRIAVWSGPRNLSTALMRSFSSRDDCVVSDEPFYAAFLARTGLDHALLIRHPARVIASYLKVRPTMTLDETGLPWQVTIVERLLRTRGTTPPIIDAADLRAAPEPTLRRFCAALEIAWDPAMLRWPAGPHPQDGVWGPHWYAATWRSIGFVPEPAETGPPLRPNVPFLDEAIALYDRLRACVNSVTPPTTRSW